MEKENVLLKIDSMLEYCDVPQLFVARDAFDTLYLCLLYDDEDACRYTAIRITQDRLQSFLQGDADLRALYVSPEQQGEYYDVVFDNNHYVLRSSPLQILPESRLPEEGYTLDNESCESIVVTVPNHDRTLFREIVRKFGWVCM